jgi:nitrate/TMAO reductase-like tetraheme cytochrome c subunit
MFWNVQGAVGRLQLSVGADEPRGVLRCHEMRDNVYQELQQTIHWKNRSGVRTVCSDCHVAKPWIYRIRRKIEASNEVLRKILGTIDTGEHRLDRAPARMGNDEVDRLARMPQLPRSRLDGPAQAIGRK